MACSAPWLQRRAVEARFLRVFFPLSGASRSASPAPTAAPSAKPIRVKPVFEAGLACSLSFMVISSVDRRVTVGESMHQSFQEMAGARPHAARHGGGGEDG